MTKGNRYDKIFRHSQKRAVKNRTQVLFKGYWNPIGFQGSRKVQALAETFWERGVAAKWADVSVNLAETEQSEVCGDVMFEK